MTSNRPLEDWGTLRGDVPADGDILDRSLHHAQTTANTGRSYRIKDLPVTNPAALKTRKAPVGPDEASSLPVPTSADAS